MTLSSVLSPYVGIVTHLDELLPACGDAWIFHTVALTANTGPLFGYRPDDTTPASGGYSSRREAAVDAALGEAVERYSAAYVPDDELVLATADELSLRTPAPESFALFAPEQYRQADFPFVPFRRDTRIRWTHGRSLLDGEPTLLPAQLVYTPWGARVDNEEPIAYSTSNGLACGTCFDDALLGGLLELLERDAFMITWNARLSLPRLDTSSQPELAAWEQMVAGRTGLRHELVDLSSFHGVPTALGIVHADGRSHGELGVGAAAATTIEQACRKALCEAYAVRAATRLMPRARRDGSQSDFGDVLTFADHIRIYADPEHASRAAFLDACRDRRDVREIAPLPRETTAALEAIVATLGLQELDAYAVDVTPPDVREAGLTVVRAIAPQLCPLDARHDARFLGAPRLLTVPFALGLRERPLTVSELNPDPHPFP